MNGEAEFLREQAAIAKIRLRLHASALGDQVVAPLQLGSFVQRRPWWSLGGAALGGVLSGLGLRALARDPRTASGRVRRLAAAVGRRARRLLGSAIGTLLVTNVWDSMRTAPPAANGHPSPATPSPSAPPPSTSPAS